MDHVVVDTEIQRTIEETPGGWDATDVLGMSCAAVYEFTADRVRIYGDTPDELRQLQYRLLRADRVTSFNGEGFDFPLIWKTSRERWKHEALLAHVSDVQTRLFLISDDLLARIWKAQGLDPKVFTDRHKGWGLDAVCEGTLGVRKIGHGADAPRWYQRGLWGILVNYCAHDVAITRDLCRFIDRYGYVVHPTKGRLAVPPWQGGA